MMLTLLFEAALRSLLMALAVWTVIRLMRVQAVVAQKVAWILVLAAAAAMPLVMHLPWLALDRAVRIPLLSPASLMQAKPTQKPADARQLTFAPLQPVHTPTAYPIAQVSHVEPPHSQQSHTDHSATTVVATTMRFQSVNPAPTAAAPAAQSKAQPKFWTVSRVRALIVDAYLLAAALLLLRILAGALIAMRLVVFSRPASGEHVGLDLPSNIRISSRLSTPVTVGSTVLLPASYDEWDKDKLRIVLAHEQSHVRQGDFYLQLVASIHAAIFWFSPLGWWLQRKISELGEALSDHAGLEQADSPASYAQVLLEFAAMPRPRNYFTPQAGVAMARNSNLSSRIERILNASRFRVAFLGGRRHAYVTALLVPASLVAAVACIRIVPAVKAAEKSSTPVTTVQFHSNKSAGTPTAACTGGKSSTASLTQSSSQSTDQVSTISFAPASGSASVLKLVATWSSDAAHTLSFAEAPTPAGVGLMSFMQDAPAAPVAAPEAIAPVPAEPVAPVPPQDAPRPPSGKGAHVQIDHSDDDGDSFSVIHDDGNNTVNWNGGNREDIDRVRKSKNLHGNYILFEHDGQSYIITDPAVLAKADQLFKPNADIEREQAMLEKQQHELNQRMEKFRPDVANLKIDSPEMKKQMAELDARLAELQTDKFKNMTANLSKQINQEVLASLQEKMGEIQNQIGELQGQIGEEMGKMGEKQGELGEEMGRIGEKMGVLGEEQGRHSEEASRKMKSVLDQAVKDGKAKPVN